MLGSVVLVVVNDDWGTTTQHFNVAGDGQSFSYALPAGAVATFVLPRAAMLVKEGGRDRNHRGEVNRAEFCRNPESNQRQKH